MEAIIPSLATHPLDDLAAATYWYRLGPDTLADVIPFLTNARLNDGVWYYDFPQARVMQFIQEQRAMPGGPTSTVYDMLANVGLAYIDMENLRASVGGRCVEVCYPKGISRPNGLLKITSGNKHLNTHD